MKTRFILVGLVGACVLNVPVSCSRKNSGSDKTVGVAADDPEMAAAIEKARGTLPEFWRVFERPERGESDFCLKVKITDRDDVEYFWLADIERKDGRILGKISNEPEFVKSVKLDQRLTIDEADISDWMYMRDGKLHGNYTLRALFKAMPQQDVEKYKRMLADP
jgi:uncharacterized protein YegJ (DUF2314 family)